MSEESQEERIARRNSVTARLLIRRFKECIGLCASGLIVMFFFGFPVYEIYAAFALWSCLYCSRLLKSTSRLDEDQKALWRARLRYSAGFVVLILLVHLCAVAWLLLKGP